MKILGLSAFFHDSAVALIDRDDIIVALQEERFSRVKNDHRFPARALKEIINLSEINSIDDLQAVVYYEKPFLTFERLLQTHMDNAPLSLSSFLQGMPVWLQQKLFLKSKIKNYLKKNFSESKTSPQLYFVEHHHAHAGSAFYPSPFEEAAVLCLDGVGEWTTSSGWHGKGNTLNPLFEIHFPHSLGLLYSAFTQFLGFKVNNGEYKLMGLSSYGEPIYVDKIKQKLIDIKDDGSFRLNLEYFDFHVGTRMINNKFSQLFGTSVLKTDKSFQKIHMDIAASIQAVTEEIIFKLADELKKRTGLDKLCLSGGVALNCVANGKLMNRGPFKEIWIQPAAGDAGSSLGAALVLSHEKFGLPRIPKEHDSMKGAYLGNKSESLHPHFKLGNDYEEEELLDRVTDLMLEGKVIGWHQGKMEFGPRALGSRSIIADPRNEKMQQKLNLKIKKRESFRPFAASLLEEDAPLFYEKGYRSPYMLLVENIHESRTKSSVKKEVSSILDINEIRSDIPAVTHVDYSCRTQTVDGKWNPRYKKLIEKFKEKTGIGLIINTSFNVRGEPIVESLRDALKCFNNTDMDALVLENRLILREDLPSLDITPVESGDIDELFPTLEIHLRFWQVFMMTVGLILLLIFSKNPAGPVYLITVLPIFMYFSRDGKKALVMFSKVLVIILDYIFNFLLKFILLLFYFFVLTPWSILYRLINKPHRFFPFKILANSYMIEKNEKNTRWSSPF